MFSDTLNSYLKGIVFIQHIPVPTVQSVVHLPSELWLSQLNNKASSHSK
ncbi:hypothetical protein QWZ13_19095 [Reinekea marina]|nr:hypothetical protein [Reinekea marina]MDN3651021.1 hypothetical protein [Reinekea marina]